MHTLIDTEKPQQDTELPTRSRQTYGYRPTRAATTAYRQRWSSRGCHVDLTCTDSDWRELGYGEGLLVLLFFFPSLIQAKVCSFSFSFFPLSSRIRRHSDAFAEAVASADTFHGPFRTLDAATSLKGTKALGPPISFLLHNSSFHPYQSSFTRPFFVPSRNSKQQAPSNPSPIHAHCTAAWKRSHKYLLPAGHPQTPSSPSHSAWSSQELRTLPDH